MVDAALAVFAHEVRTPLTGILAISDLLATSELGERERRWVETIKAGAEHLSNLATLFVDAAKDETTVGIVLRQDLFDLRVLARAAGDSLAGRAAAKGLQAHGRDLDRAARAGGWRSGPSACAALENLVDNAVKFTEQGGVVINMSRRPSQRLGEPRPSRATRRKAKSARKRQGRDRLRDLR